MKTLLPLALLVLAASASAETGPTTRRDAEAQWSQAGLQRTDMRGMDLAYARPGASLAPYRRVLLRPVDISFQRNWQRTAAQSTGTRIAQRDFQKVADDMSAVVREQVGRELERGGFTVVDAPGPDVLQIDVHVVELFLNAPDFPGAAQTRSYSQSFGEMTLVADLRDSRSGELLMSVLDRSIGRDFDQFRLTTRVENAREVGLAAQNWAGTLRRQLELARANGQGSNGRP
jgi:hypothetical protein